MSRYTHKSRVRKSIENVVRSVRMTKELDDRIGVLADKGLVTKNYWIVRTLTREAGITTKDADNAITK
jgi:predicted DNA-binding protein